MRTLLILTATLFAAGLLPAGAQAEKGHAKSNLDARFARMDQDKNGQVTKEEFLGTKHAQANPEKAGKRFIEVDQNEDGSITLEELKAARHKKGKGKGQGANPY